MSDVVDNPAKSRFELDIDGHVAVRGIGSMLARGALDHVRASGLKAIAQCEFIAGYLEKHPEYADLVASRPA
jgi:predicted GNAT family acetyltransferase